MLGDSLQGGAFLIEVFCIQRPLIQVQCSGNFITNHTALYAPLGYSLTMFQMGFTFGYQIVSNEAWIIPRLIVASPHITLNRYIAEERILLLFCS